MPSAITPAPPSTLLGFSISSSRSSLPWWQAGFVTLEKPASIKSFFKLFASHIHLNAIREEISVAIRGMVHLHVCHKQSTYGLGWQDPSFQGMPALVCTQQMPWGAIALPKSRSQIPSLWESRRVVTRLGVKGGSKLFESLYKKSHSFCKRLCKRNLTLLLLCFQAQLH